MKVLVTGGAGFVGSHLCDALIGRDYQVWCIDNLYLGKESNIEHFKNNQRFHFRKLDMLDSAGMNKLFSKIRFDTVFHLAANSDIQQGNRDHKIDLNLNFLTTFELLEIMKRYEIKRLFFASTSAIFGRSADILNENYGPLKPISFYGACKLAAEAYISVFVEHYNLKSWILRFPNVVGERCTHGAIYDFINQLRKNPYHLTVLGDGTQAKPYIYVKDLVKAILLVFDKAPEQLAVYHVGGEDLVSVRQIADLVIKEMGLTGVRTKYTGGTIGWAGDVPTFKYDMNKIKRLGFLPNYNSRESVRVAIQKILGK